MNFKLSRFAVFPLSLLVPLMVVPPVTAQTGVFSPPRKPVATDTNWVSMGTSHHAGGIVLAFAASGGNLYVGGSFSARMGWPSGSVARWNESGWSALGSGIDDYSVRAIAVFGTNVYAGGQFTSAGGVPVNHIAKWDGRSWSALGSGVNSQVNALAVMGGNLYVGGEFTTAGGVPANYLAKWDGSEWSAVPGAWTFQVCALAVSGTNLYVGGMGSTVDNNAVIRKGLFIRRGAAECRGVARWDGSRWSCLGPVVDGAAGVNGLVNALAVSGTNLYVGGLFSAAGGKPANAVARWDGRKWSALGSGLGMDGSIAPAMVNALAASGSTVYVGGDFTSAGGVRMKYLAEYDGNHWSAPGSDFYNGGSVLALAVSGNQLHVGGNFNLVGGDTVVATRNIAIGDQQ